MATTHALPIEAQIAESHLCLCGAPDCLGHEVVNDVVQFPGFTSASVADRCVNKIWMFDGPTEDGIYAFTDGTDQFGPVPESVENPSPFLYRWRPRE